MAFIAFLNRQSGHSTLFFCWIRQLKCNNEEKKQSVLPEVAGEKGLEVFEEHIQELQDRKKQLIETKKDARI